MTASSSPLIFSGLVGVASRGGLLAATGGLLAHHSHSPHFMHDASHCMHCAVVVALHRELASVVGALHRELELDRVDTKGSFMAESACSFLF